MDLASLNTIARNDFLERKRLSELKPNEKYLVTKVKQVKTSFGQSVVITLNHQFNVFLPERVCNILIADTNLLNDLSNKANTNLLYLTYLGGKNKFEFISVNDLIVKKEEQ